MGWADATEAHLSFWVTAGQPFHGRGGVGISLQLRPSANVFDLARNFNLEVSLFERMVTVGLPFVRLNFQVRADRGFRVGDPFCISTSEGHCRGWVGVEVSSVSSPLLWTLP